MSIRNLPQRTLGDISLKLSNLFIVSNFLHLCHLVVADVHIG